MKAIRILKSSLVGLVLGLLSMSACAQVCGDGGQIVSNGGSLLCVNGSAGTRPYGSHTYDGVGAPSSGGYTKPSKPRVLDSKYGAVALDMKTGAFDSAYGETSEAIAKKNALARCNSKNCKIIGSYRNTCVAVAHGLVKKGGIAPINYGTQKTTAEANALKLCKDKGATNCQIMMPAECSLPQ
jgi:hypothetical protein